MSMSCESSFSSNFIHKAERLLTGSYIRSKAAKWDRDTNINDATKANYNKAAAAGGELKKELSQEAQKFDLNQIQDAEVKRKMESIRNLDGPTLSATKSSQFYNIKDFMSTTYRYVHKANTLSFTNNM